MLYFKKFVISITNYEKLNFWMNFLAVIGPSADLLFCSMLVGLMQEHNKSFYGLIQADIMLETI